ncbi:membrane protein [Neisseria gonorrhoeae]|uniref:Membrane protein n=1 Tax=Neisseria gonorrhoeae TaxID=485 RepID=A0A378W091_NEIGO|nr:membrane protein [Neisseria gonorrhoeae]
MAAATEFDAQRYDVAEGHLKWVLSNQKDSLIQALAAQRLGVVLLQQKNTMPRLPHSTRRLRRTSPPADGN